MQHGKLSKNGSNRLVDGYVTPDGAVRRSVIGNTLSFLLLVLGSVAARVCACSAFRHVPTGIAASRRRDVSLIGDGKATARVCSCATAHPTCRFRTRVSARSSAYLAKGRSVHWGTEGWTSPKRSPKTGHRKGGCSHSFSCMLVRVYGLRLVSFDEESVQGRGQTAKEASGNVGEHHNRMQSVRNLAISWWAEENGGIQLSTMRERRYHTGDERRT